MVGKILKAMIVALALHMAFFFSVQAFAVHEEMFQLKVNQPELLVGDECNLTIVKAEENNAKIVSIEGIEAFDVMIHNKSTILYNLESYTPYTEEYYRIRANSTGNFTLKAIIEYNGELYETNTIELTVSERPKAEHETLQDVFVDSYISREDAYLGEKLVVIYELYSRHNVDAFGITDYFAIEDMLIKNITDDKPKREQVYIKDVRFEKYEVLKLILEPVKMGAFIIPSFRLQANVIIGDSPVDGSGKPFSKPKPMFLQTDEMNLNVLPLPSEGRPDNFTGIVGSLQIDGEYNRDEVDYGDSLSVSITAFGSCNLVGLSDIYSGGVPGFTVYETLKATTEYVENKQYYAAKEFQITLVPKRSGKLDVSPLSFAYFNPDLGKYVTAEFPGATVTVNGDTLQPNYGEEVQTGVIETIRINQANYSDSDSDDDFINIRISKKIIKRFLIIIAILIMLPAAYIWFNSNKKKRDPVIKSLYRQMMAAKNDNAVYKHFNDMFKHLYFLNLKASSKDTVRKTLSDSELAKQVTDVMDYMESLESRGGFDLKKKTREIYLILRRN